MPQTLTRADHMLEIDALARVKHCVMRMLQSCNYHLSVMWRSIIRLSNATRALRCEALCVRDLSKSRRANSDVA